MKRASFVIGAAALLVTGLAAADPRPGSDGTVTAYWEGGGVIKVVQCPLDPVDKDGKTFKYAKCTREAVDAGVAAVCKKKGKGRHKFTLQIGTNPKASQKATCK
jgi:hypothetical protein